MELNTSVPASLLVIDLPYRQQENGQIIYQQLEHYCRQKGVKTLRLGVLVDNLAGRKMWEKQGFVKIADKIINGKHHLVCEKKLV
ncbi:GNAT family N-acetyltransferase [Enterococcus durans]|uniref:GNAT family N-acetyltransferase n=1 Tax=Enterococcus durans TaxID=53345 RepID=UPI001883A832|nr:GNAT family N-acetyltransferase [Enterococcus durans]MBE9886782.1 GNAT family N-acetyltransferase [Enterococcus durans]